ncbi:MAG: DUF1801 domain-containing protein [Henriciella sp.]|uniref:DUF1801 domain-containing protein n=1 Tax=Henriciella sp. TaxID=1968823 RepID=UPI0032ED26EA
MPLTGTRPDKPAASEQPPQKVRKAFDAVPDRVRHKWYALRALILQTAEATPGVGPLTETLKWGEPSYAAASGTPVRLGWKPAEPDTIKLLVHCQTSLVDDWRERYGEMFRFEGTRALLLDVNAPLPDAQLSHCIAMALTYKRR